MHQLGGGRAHVEHAGSLAAVKALDKAVEAAASAKNDELERVLQVSREPLLEQLAKMGLKAPAAPARKGRRSRKGEAAEDITPVLDAVGSAIKKNERAAEA